MEHELKALQGKMIQAAKRRDETLRRQFTRAQAQTFPHGHPQERTLAVVYFLNQYGPALVDRLLEELPHRSWAALGALRSRICRLAARDFATRKRGQVELRRFGVRSCEFGVDADSLATAAFNICRAAQALDPRLQPTVVLGQAQP